MGCRLPLECFRNWISHFATTSVPIICSPIDFYVFLLVQSQIINAANEKFQQPVINGMKPFRYFGMHLNYKAEKTFETCF